MSSIERRITKLESVTRPKGVCMLWRPNDPRQLAAYRQEVAKAIRAGKQVMSVGWVSDERFVWDVPNISVTPARS